MEYEELHIVSIFHQYSSPLLQIHNFPHTLLQGLIKGGEMGDLSTPSILMIFINEKKQHDTHYKKIIIDK